MSMIMARLPFKAREIFDEVLAQAGAEVVIVMAAIKMAVNKVRICFVI